MLENSGTRANVCIPQICSNAGTVAAALRARSGSARAALCPYRASALLELRSNRSTKMQSLLLNRQTPGTVGVIALGRARGGLTCCPRAQRAEFIIIIVGF